MIEGIPRISVYIITYNQEDVIDRTLGSILNQLDYVFEICVSDDCSSDRTWDILNEYAVKYPGLFKLNRNESNLGIFENTEKVWTMPTGDIVYDLAGDDSVGDFFFKEVVQFIMDNEIDYKNEFFCIYGDYKAVYPNGDSIVFSNKAIKKYSDDALRLAWRGLITGRACCYSIKVLHSFELVSQGRSHVVEVIQDRQIQIYSEYNYYIPYIGNIYYSAVGVSSHIDDRTFSERQEIWNYSLEYFEKKGIKLNAKDVFFGTLISSIDDFRRDHSFLGIISIIKYYFLSRDFSLPSGNGFRHFVFAVIRRFPHNKPIGL